MQPIDCLHDALNRPTSVIVTGIDNDAVPEQAFQAASSFRPISAAAEARIIDATVGEGRDGRYGLFKTTAHLDGIAHNPDWLGPDRDTGVDAEERRLIPRTPYAIRHTPYAIRHTPYAIRDPSRTSDIGVWSVGRCGSCCTCR